MIVHKADACIIRGPKFLLPSLIINMDQFNAFHGEETNELPREWNNQPPEYQLKSKTSTLNTSPMVSSIRGVFNHHAVDNGDVEFYTSDYPLKSTYDSITDPDTAPTNSIDDDKTVQLPGLFHS